MFHVNHDARGDTQLINDSQKVVMIEVGDSDQSLKNRVLNLRVSDISGINYLRIIHSDEDDFGRVIPLIENRATIENLYFKELTISKV
jgi:hypothetical protein